MPLLPARVDIHVTSPLSNLRFFIIILLSLCLLPVHAVYQRWVIAPGNAPRAAG